MEKQEIEQLDLKDWVFVFATPNMGWLGRRIGDGGVSKPAELHEAYTFTVMEFPVPQGQTIGFLRNAGINNVADCLSAVPILVMGLALVRCELLDSSDKAQIVRWVEARRAENVKRRLGRSGLVTK